MQNKILKLSFSLVTFLMLPNLAWAGPSITSATINAGTLDIVGENFGTKTVAVPFYFSNFDSETIGQMPAGQISNLSAGNQGVVAANEFRGARSLEFNYCADTGSQNWILGNSYEAGNVVLYNANAYTVLVNVPAGGSTPDLDSLHYSLGFPAPNCGAGGDRKEDWKRNVIDLGVDGSEYIYLSYWLYLDKNASTSLSWQWKNVIITSASNMYYSLVQDESVFGQETWYFSNNRWGNSGSPNLYYWSNANNGAKISVNLGAASDFFILNGWQRIGIYIKRSSIGGVADGSVIAERIGRQNYLYNAANITTHDVGNKPLRYVDLSNGIASVYEGFVDLDVYMDDVYLDTTQARLEICDSATWAARTHCEIQKPTAWAEASSAAVFNQGTFFDGTTAYLYVVDGNGDVNLDGYPLTLPGVLDVTPPAAPTGLGVM